MVQNWQQVHEREHEAYRWQLIDRNIPQWGRKVGQAGSSYTTELEAIAKMIMISPGAWDLEIVTDSESAMNKLDGKESKGKGSGWQVVELIRQLRTQRTGTVTFTHQRSHKKMDTENSVGNATADLIADRYTWQTESQRQTKEVTKLHNGDRVTIMDGRTGTWLTRDLKKAVKKTKGRGRREDMDIRKLAGDSQGGNTGPEGVCEEAKEETGRAKHGHTGKTPNHHTHTRT